MAEFTSSYIENDPIVREFLENRDKPLSRGTKKNYISVLTNYSNVIDKMPSEWIDEANNEMESGVNRKNRRIKQYFEIFHRYLERKRRSVITMNRSFTDLKTFYHFFDIDTPQNPVRRPQEHRETDTLTKDELKRAVRNANVRDRAIIYLCSSSGMGIKEVINLKYTDFLKALGLPENLGESEIIDKLDEVPIPEWHLYNEVTDTDYITFSTPETVYNLIDYLEQRKFHSEWLFTGQNKDEQMFEGTLVNAFARLNDKLGFGSKAEGRGRRFTTTALRLYFREALRKAGVDTIKVMFMMGLKIPSELDLSPSSLKKDYRRSLNELSLEPIEVKMVTDETIDDLQKRVRELEEKLRDKEQ